MKNEKNFKVSIIVPVHNAEKTLDECLRSILNQSYENIECILVENGSEDLSQQICLNYERMYDTVKTYISKKQGVSSARNLGLTAATGDIIGFCDADDFMEENAIESVVTEFEKNANIDCVIGAFYVGQWDGKTIKKEYKGIKSRTISTFRAMEFTIGHDAVMGSVWNKYFRADVVKKIFFDSTLAYCEDMHFNIQVMSRTCREQKVKVIDTPLYCYMENTASVTHQNDRLFDCDGELKYITAVKKIEQDCQLSRKVGSVCKMKIACFAIDTLCNMKVTGQQKTKLLQELNKNYIHLILNVYKFNWKWNLKRAFRGWKIRKNRMV